MEIVNKIKFPIWNKFKDSVGHVDSIKTINFSVYNYDNEYITAECRWCYTSNAEKAKFEYSEEGYNKACAWIEEQRIKLIEQLL